MDSHITKNKNGQSFFEVLMALAMVTLILTTLVSLATISVRNATRTKNESLATRYSQEGIEWLRSQRDASWVSFSNFSAPSPNGKTWCINTLNFNSSGTCASASVIAGTALKREANLTIDLVGDPSGNTINATVRTYWSDGQGYHEQVTSTDFTSWK